jgi:hypothetical protein
MNRFDFYKELYFYEISRKNEISNSISITIGIISAFSGVIFYLLTSFDYGNNNIVTSIFIISLFPVLVFLMKSIYYLVRSFSNFTDGHFYKYLSSPKDFENYYGGLEEYYKKSRMENGDSNIDFDNHLISQFIETTSFNQKRNNDRVFHRFLSHRNIIYTFLSICLILVPFGINFGINKKVPNIESVKINSTEIITNVSCDSLNRIQKIINCK